MHFSSLKKSWANRHSGFPNTLIAASRVSVFMGGGTGDGDQAIRSEHSAVGADQGFVAWESE